MHVCPSHPSWTLSVSPLIPYTTCPCPKQPPFLLSLAHPETSRIKPKASRRLTGTYPCVKSSCANCPTILVPETAEDAVGLGSIGKLVYLFEHFDAAGVNLGSQDHFELEAELDGVHIVRAVVHVDEYAGKMR